MTWSSVSAIDRTPAPMLKDEKFTDANTIIAIGHDPAMIGNTFAVDLGLWGNVRQTLTVHSMLSWKPDHANLQHIQRRRQALMRHKARNGWRMQVPTRANERANLKCRSIPTTWAKPWAGRWLKNTLLVSENFRAADHLMPFGYGRQ